MAENGERRKGKRRRSMTERGEEGGVKRERVSLISDGKIPRGLLAIGGESLEI